MDGLIPVHVYQSTVYHVIYHHILIIFFHFAALGTSGHRLSIRQAPNANELSIIPAGPHHMPVGRNLFFTCKAVVHNPELVRDLKWIGPNGDKIPQDDRLEKKQQKGRFIYQVNR